MDSLAIRKATPQDIPAILRLYHDAQIDGEIGFTVEEAIEHLQSLSRYPYFCVFVALSDKARMNSWSWTTWQNEEGNQALSKT